MMNLIWTYLLMLPYIDIFSTAFFADLYFSRSSELFMFFSEMFSHFRSRFEFLMALFTFPVTAFLLLWDDMIIWFWIRIQTTSALM